MRFYLNARANCSRLNHTMLLVAFLLVNALSVSAGLSPIYPVPWFFRTIPYNGMFGGYCVNDGTPAVTQGKGSMLDCCGWFTLMLRPAVPAGAKLLSGPGHHSNHVRLSVLRFLCCFGSDWLALRASCGTAPSPLCLG